MKKKSIELGPYVVVPNSAAKKLVFKKKTKAAAKSGKGNLLAEAYRRNLSSKNYDVRRQDDHAVVVVREKDSGRTVSEFQVPSAKKKVALRKLALKPSPGGTISIKKILDSIG